MVVEGECCQVATLNCLLLLTSSLKSKVAAGAVTSLILTKRYFATTETGTEKLKLELYTVYTTLSVVQHLLS